MKVLVSTKLTQGDSPGDFCFVPDGELVGRHQMVCDSERPDGSGCGCGRSFSGFVTPQGTTSAIVTEQSISEAGWRAALMQSLGDTGWAELMTGGELAGLIDELVEFDLEQIQQVPVGTVVGRRAYNEPSGEMFDQLHRRAWLSPPFSLS